MIENIKEKIFKTESKIMQLEQTIFYAKKELDSLKFNLQNMKNIVSRT